MDKYCYNKTQRGPHLHGFDEYPHYRNHGFGSRAPNMRSSRRVAEFLCVSASHFGCLYRTDRVPEPIRIGERKLGWRMGDLIDSVDTKADASPRRSGKNTAA
jgi:predicted DNA-binding transcriptional regulator AlpA